MRTSDGIEDRVGDGRWRPEAGGLGHRPDAERPVARRYLDQDVFYLRHIHCQGASNTSPAKGSAHDP